MRADMGQDKIRYFLFLEGRWRWRPTKTMREAGFRMVPMGHGGPELDIDGNPAPSVQDKQRALEPNAEWDAVRSGLQPPSKLDRPLFAHGASERRLSSCDGLAGRPTRTERHRLDLRTKEPRQLASRLEMDRPGIWRL